MQINKQKFEEVEVSDGDFNALKPGGYVVEIYDVKDNAEKRYLTFLYDIVEGDHAGHFRDDSFFDDKDWAHNAYVSYTDNAMPIFKGFIEKVEKSNSGFNFDFDESSLNGKKVGVILGEEEYMSNQGEVKKSLKVKGYRDISKIRAGEYKVPELKKLETESKESTQSVPQVDTSIYDEDIPF